MTDTQQTYPDGVASAVTYCRDVLSGAIAACRLVQLTCARFISPAANFSCVPLLLRTASSP